MWVTTSENITSPVVIAEVALSTWAYSVTIISISDIYKWMTFVSLWMNHDETGTLLSLETVGRCECWYSTGAGWPLNWFLTQPSEPRRYVAPLLDFLLQQCGSSVWEPVLATLKTRAAKNKLARVWNREEKWTPTKLLHLCWVWMWSWAGLVCSSSQTGHGFVCCHYCARESECLQCACSAPKNPLLTD